MKLKSIIVSVDVGTDFIKATATEVHNGELYILGSTFQKSQGFEKNKVVNKTKFINSINLVLNELELLLGVKIDGVVASLSINNPTIKVVNERTPVSNSDNQVTSEDVKRLISRFKSDVRESQSIINVIPMEIYVDDQKTSFPIGKSGTDLAMKAMVISCENSVLFPILIAFEESDYNILDVCLQEVADSFEAIGSATSENKCLINLGYKFSRVTLYEGRAIKVSHSLNFGFRSLYNVVMNKYLVNKEGAYNIIESLGSMSSKSTVIQEFIVVENINGEKIKIMHDELNYTLRDIACELLYKIKSDFDTTYQDDYQVVFTGGLVEITDFDRLIKEIFGKKAIVYQPKYLGARNSVYSVCIGLARYMYYMEKLTDTVSSSINLEEQNSLVSSKKNWKTLDENSVVGKIFGLFFE